MKDLTIESVLAELTPSEFLNSTLSNSDRTKVGYNLIEGVKAEKEDCMIYVVSVMFHRELCFGIYAVLRNLNAVTLGEAVCPEVVKELNHLRRWVNFRLTGKGEAPTEPYILSYFKSKDKIPTREKILPPHRHDLLRTSRAINSPAPEGTVKELAARYGVSISEVRRLKAAGQLHTLDQRTAGDSYEEEEMNALITEFNSLLDSNGAKVL